MASPPEMLNSTLTPEEVRRWRFSEPTDYSEQKRRGLIPQSAAEVIAAYEPVMAEAAQLAAQYRAEFIAHPTAWTSYSREESDAKLKHYHHLERRAYSQEFHSNKLRESYSQLLAQSIWWAKVDAAETARKAKHDAWDAACAAHRAEQDAFELAQVDAAMATLPALPEATQKRLRTLLKWAIHRASRYTKGGECFSRERDGAKRRVMRGLPPVRVGVLPHPTLPKPDYTFHWHAF
jgi:hypothetical protein